MRKADFIVVAAVTAVVGIILFFLYGTNNEPGSYVRVELDGEVVDTIALDEELEREYISAGGGRNTLVISGGKAMVTEADCPDGICTNHSAISLSGESIICLPHKLVVTVRDTADDAEIDAVA